MHTPLTHGPGHRPPSGPHAKQPDGDRPQVKAPQSLSTGGWVHVPRPQTSRVQALPSSVQAVPSARGTHARPSHPVQAGQREHTPVWQVRGGSHMPQSWQPDGERPQLREPQSLARGRE
jgi:hypothetical protein